ncbi:peptidase M14, partial [Candidatus Sumerlaeota bacterium]|nr:peptidase M14 [Candidatus Sumerlaeota bacterium]
MLVFAGWGLLSAPTADAGLFGADKPKADDPAEHSFPALGASVAERKVDVDWNRYYDHAGLGAILARIHKAYPDLTELYSVGKSVEGRDLWCLEVTAKKVGDPKRKPGMYIDGNIHGNEVQAGETVAYTAWYLCLQYGHLEKVTQLLNERVFYLIPTINPDGRDHWFHHAQTEHSSRSGLRPYDNDHDGLVDEDDVDDLDGDGSITFMRIKDPNGRYKPHPDYPEYLMVEAKPDERGQYSILGYEGIDNDGDGLINEDPAGGYDTNRNWAYDWQPNYIQYGSQDYPFSLPEPRALSEFVIAHPNIAAAQSYHNAGGMILRSPGRAGGISRPEDDRIMEFIGEQGRRMIPYYRNFVIWKDLYTTWGNEVDWFYGGRGILCFTNELWTGENLYRKSGDTTEEEEANFMKHVLMEDGIVKWHEFDHPTYGKIEIGGTKKEWGRTPPSFLLEEECHRNMAFTLYHADMMPMLRIQGVEIEKLDSGLFKIWVAVENQRMIPTRSAQDVAEHIGPPDVITLSGRKIKVLS